MGPSHHLIRAKPICAPGSGKSTLLRCINLLTIPDGGDNWTDGGGFWTIFFMIILPMSTPILIVAIISGRPHRANGDLALHVLEIIEGPGRAAEGGRRVKIASRCKRPSPVPAGNGEEAFLDERDT